MIASDNDQLRTPLDPPHVAVCIATYRRPLGLRRLLASLAALEFTQIPAVKLTLVIVDNDASTPPDPTLQIELASGPYPVIYVVEPSRGLAAVRNACLDHVPADADFVACVDDDEWVVGQVRLLRCRTNTNLIQYANRAWSLLFSPLNAHRF